MAERRPSLVRRVAWWVLGLPVLVVAVLFAIENKGDLALRFWPTPYTLTMKVYVAVFGSLLVGFFFGGFFAWMAQGKRRAAQRQAEREAERLKREAEDLRRRLDLLESAQRPVPPPVITQEQARRQLVVANS
ncbi:MAG: DUF1049 domain-containing protein [Rhodospirillales bacterium]|nr:DUF1049 domain-containing protein [Rhodospirillales bacterium]